MKHNVRIVAVAIVSFTIVVSIVLLADFSTSDEPQKYYDTRLGALQGQFEDAFGLRKISQRPDLSLKNIHDVNDHLYINNKGGKSRQGTSTNLTVMFDETVERLLVKLEKIRNFGYTKESLRRSKFTEMAYKLGRSAREGSERLLPLSTHRHTSKSNYYKFHHNVRAGALYDPADPAIEGLLHDMATDEFEYIEMMEKGTELKILVTFGGGTKAVFKPMRWGRDYETLPNHYYFNDYERHNAEIAAFHLDRLLGFYRVPPVSGRYVNMTKEIFLLAEKKLRKTFYVSPIGNLCFYGECSYYCDSRHSFCGNFDMIEGSLMVWLPEGPDTERDRWKSPYRRSYSKFRKAEWEKDDEYCNKLLRNPPYLYKRFIPDLVDSHVFDFLTGNMDRHHTEVFHHLRNKTCPIHLDNGRGFGKANFDEFSILAPLRQCCQIRKSTLLKLAKLYIGPERLSALLDDSMKSDPVYPILLRGHLNALDRRVVHILKIVAQCIDEMMSPDDVIIDDGY